MALVESMKEESAFISIKESYDLEEDKEEYFQMQGICFYPNCFLQKLSYVLTQDFNFIVIDFGIYSESMVHEFMRCTIPVIVSGSKAWELEQMNCIFESQELPVLKSYHYLFNFTSGEVQEEIRLNMEPMEHVYFQEYIPDPFSDSVSQAFGEILKGYMTEEKVKTEKGKKFPFLDLGGVFKRK